MRADADNTKAYYLYDSRLSDAELKSQYDLFNQNKFDFKVAGGARVAWAADTAV